MTKISTKTISILALSVATIAMIVGLSQTTMITAENKPAGNDMYIFAEGVYPQATFEFRDATVTYEFQAYTTTNSLFGSNGGFTTRQVAPEFTLQRIVGNTPYLHEAVDQTFEFNGKSTGFDYPYKQFDVTVEMVQAGQSVRTMEYADCSVNNYKILTDFDKEEGYVTGGKTGFAVMETFTFVCAGFTPVAPLFDQMIEEQQNHKPYE
jgi:hypothetical protein